MDSVESRIRNAALRLFARHGFEATGIRDIARDAGVSSAALYHYMGTKEDLLLQIITVGLERLDQACRKAIAAVRTPEERLAALVQLHVLFHARHRLWAVVGDQELRALSAEARRQVMPLVDGYEQLWQEVLEEGTSRGRFHLPHTKAVRLALLGMCNAVARWFTPVGPMTAEDVAAIYADAALAMVDARRARHRVRLADLRMPDPSHYSDLLAEVFPGPLL